MSSLIMTVSRDIYRVPITVSHRLSVCDYVAVFFMDTGDFQRYLSALDLMNQNTKPRNITLGTVILKNLNGRAMPITKD